MSIDVIWSIRILTLETPSKKGWLGYSKEHLLQLNRTPTSISLPFTWSIVRILPNLYKTWILSKYSSSASAGKLRMVSSYLIPYRNVSYHTVIYYIYLSQYISYPKLRKHIVLSHIKLLDMTKYYVIVISKHIISHRLIFYDANHMNHIVSYCTTLYDIVWYHILLCHMISCYVIFDHDIHIYI